MPPLTMSLLVTLLGLFAGVAFVMQQAVNSQLHSALGSAAWTGFASYLGGTICMLVMALATHDELPSMEQLLKASWWTWSGGFFGALYIGISIGLLPRIGAAAFVALLVAGQMLASVAFDHFSAFGLPQYSANPSRLVGAFCLILGVFLISRKS